MGRQARAAMGLKRQGNVKDPSLEMINDVICLTARHNTTDGGGHIRPPSPPERSPLLPPPTATLPAASPPTPAEGGRAGGGLFKSGHACGSLFAKCACSNHQLQPRQQQQQQQQHQDAAPAVASRTQPVNVPHKRYSEPEVFVSHRRGGGSRGNAKLSLAKSYLNHPDIPFPVPDPTPTPPDNSCDIKVPNFRRSSSRTNLHSKSLDFTDNLDHPAHKFLKDFGIFAGPMGNGVASIRKSSNKSQHEAPDQHRKSIADPPQYKKSISVPADYEYLKSIVPRLEKELSDLELKYGAQQAELLQTKKELQSRDTDILKLQREIHKLKSVLLQTIKNDGDDILARLQELPTMANRTIQHQVSLTNSSANKKQGVSAESSESTGQPSDITVPKYDKDFRSKQLIKDAILDNDFLKNLDSGQIRELVESMYPRAYKKGSSVIREGDAGAHLFVSAEGEFEVVKDEKVLGRMGSGKAFGELAILYNCTRTASIRVVTDSNVWVLDRKVFQQIMVRTGLQRLQDNINFLKSVPLLQNLNNDVLAKIADVLEVEFYPSGAYIIRQGASGDTFFIISSGRVKITQRMPGRLEEEEIRVLQRGDYFGEQALLKEESRTASVIALHPGVECLTLDRDSFIQLIGDLSEIKEKDYGDGHRLLVRPTSSNNMQELAEYEYIQLDDLDVIATLGIGGFGRVELVQYSRDPSLTFALKCLKKQHIVDTQQQDHVFSEKVIMMGCRSQFICRLYRTYRDNKYVYMLLEACLGGEVWTILRDRGCFDEHTTRFIAACVVEAFEYMHARGIIYRDLKPENLLLDAKGYVKLVDFGFSKRLGYSNKTWTFCGTPEYVAPETILNKGHDRAVDYWALGVLMHELLSGNPPFSANDPMRTYNLILKGIDMIDFAKFNVSRTAQSLIKKLCRDAPSERLGYQRGGISDIKKHKWFQGFDWDGLIGGTLTAPIIQRVRGPCDSSNFDCYSKDNDIPPDEVSNWDLDF